MDDSSLARADALTTHPSPAASDGVRNDWQNVMTAEEVEEFGAIETAIAHTKQALTALSVRRAKIRNRLVMRINWRKKHVG